MDQNEIARQQLEETRRLRIATEKMNKRQGFSIGRVIALFVLLGLITVIVLPMCAHRG